MVRITANAHLISQIRRGSGGLVEEDEVCTRESAPKVLDAKSRSWALGLKSPMSDICLGAKVA